SVLIVAFATFVALFARISPRYPSTKQRSWILTALASSVMSLASLPFLLDFVKGGKVSSLVERRWLSESACRFFQVYLFSDLSIGSLYYRDRINLLTGWVHHIVYIILMQVLLSWQWTHLFLLAAIMELPTFILSISYLFPQTRNDIFFAAVFFITRIAFHIVVIIQLLNPGIRRATVNGSFWAPALYIVALPMHVHWFIGCVRGILKRSKADNSPSP
ncbi:uncharacterized protein EI90DRAFT_2821183, partial [Cantharellus anzutake]|uniref:uncharacterized protein n=1 Tax=Cantharellus anzutake TaxID=1750568 RepID=UPI001908B33D